MRICLSAILCLLFSMVLAQAPKAYLLKVGKLYNSEQNTFIRNQEILVQGNKIVKVGTGLKKPEGAEVINLGSCTVTPGLIDAHTHILYLQKPEEPMEVDILMNSDIERSLRAVKIARTFLDAGFTTIRDLGNSGQYLDLNMRRAIDKGLVAGPRMIISGPILSPEDGQFFGLSLQNRPVIDREYTVVRNVDEARQAVKDHISHQVDLIKVVMGDGRLTLPVEEVKEIVNTAHRYGIKVTAHATYDMLVERALDAGVDGIEHGYSIADSLLDRMARQQVYLVPTIGTYEGYKSYYDPENKRSKEELEGLTSFVNNTMGIVKRAFEKGVMIVNGSDMYLVTPKPQGDAAKNTLEAIYHAIGSKAADALQAATRNAARACGVDGFTGIIKENMRADIVAFDGDLEKDFQQTLYKVKFVMKDGEVYVNK